MLTRLFLISWAFVLLSASFLFAAKNNQGSKKSSPNDSNIIQDTIKAKYPTITGNLEIKSNYAAGNPAYIKPNENGSIDSGMIHKPDITVAKIPKGEGNANVDPKFTTNVPPNKISTQTANPPANNNMTQQRLKLK